MGPVVEVEIIEFDATSAPPPGRSAKAPVNRQGGWSMSFWVTDLNGGKRLGLRVRAQTPRFQKKNARRSPSEFERSCNPDRTATDDANIIGAAEYFLGKWSHLTVPSASKEESIK
jgi:hypothetical protein